jgi:hypothetical protein
MENRKCGVQYFIIFSHQLNNFLETDPVTILQEAGWVLGPVWMGVEDLIPTGIRSTDRPARSDSLYRLSYPDPRMDKLAKFIGLPVWTFRGS